MALYTVAKKKNEDVNTGKAMPIMADPAGTSNPVGVDDSGKVIVNQTPSKTNTQSKTGLMDAASNLLKNTDTSNGGIIKPAANTSSGGSGSGSGSSAPSWAQGDAIAQWTNPYQSQRDDLYAQIMNPGKFSYDLYADNMYRQYKEQYENLGQKAMQDTMGQAAALTGGYGSTYAQGVGQQSYYDYLNQLNNVVPTLEQNAYDRWAADEDRKLTQFNLVQNMYDRAIEDKNEAASRLTALIARGYTPSDEELYAAGLSRQEASMYAPRSSGSTGGNGSGTQLRTNSKIGGATGSTKVALYRDNQIAAQDAALAQQFGAYQDEVNALNGEYYKAKQDAIMKGATQKQLAAIDQMYDERFAYLDRRYGY